MFYLRTKNGNINLRKISSNSFIAENHLESLEILDDIFYEINEQGGKRKIKKQKRAETANKTAYIIPFFSFYENDRMAELFEIFKQQIPKQDLFVIELSFFDLPFYIKESESFIRLKGGEENLMWQKERILNIALENIPKEYTNVAWLDCDVIFENTNWKEDLHLKLNDHSVVQLFEKVTWLNEDKTLNKEFSTIVKSDKMPDGHPGFAWAARREELDKFKFFEYSIDGGGDTYMYFCFSGKKILYCENQINKLHGFEYKINDYIKLLNENMLSDVGYVDGTIKHMFHGKYENRKYVDRYTTLNDNKYDPVKDLFIDDNGLFKWNLKNKSALAIQNYIKQYYKFRKENDYE